MASLYTQSGQILFEPHGVSRLAPQLGPRQVIGKTRQRQISKRGLIYCAQAPGRFQTNATQVFILAQTKPCQSSTRSPNEPRGLQIARTHFNSLVSMSTPPSDVPPVLKTAGKHTKSCCRKQKHKEKSHYISNGSCSPLPPCLLSSSTRVFPSICQFNPASSKKILHNLKIDFLFSWVSDQFKQDTKSSKSSKKGETELIPTGQDSENDIMKNNRLSFVRRCEVLNEVEVDEENSQQKDLSFFNSFNAFETQEQPDNNPFFYDTNTISRLESSNSSSSSDSSNVIPSSSSSSCHHASLSFPSVN